MSLEDDIKGEAIELGFDAVGITDAPPIDAGQVELLSTWLKAGYAGQMRYMHRNFEKRINPAKLLENAQSVIVVGLNYKPPKPAGGGPKQARLWRAGPTGRIAEYAQYEDYHPFMKKRLGNLADFVTSITGEGVRFKICVDSAPLAERSVALRAGLGFIGKNHTLIHPALGPQIFLGEIVTTLRLRPDTPSGGNCAGCNRCMDACPTGALRGDGQFDANKCISYLTIEYKGPIPAEQAERMGDRLFGCDECVLACPYRTDAPPCKNQELKFYPDRAGLDLDEMLSLSIESSAGSPAPAVPRWTGTGRPQRDKWDFDRRLGNSPIRRPGLDILKRNARICAANAGNTRGERR